MNVQNDKMRVEIKHSMYYFCIVPSNEVHFIPDNRAYDFSERRCEGNHFQVVSPSQEDRK